MLRQRAAELAREILGEINQNDEKQVEEYFKLIDKLISNEYFRAEMLAQLKLREQETASAT